MRLAGGGRPDRRRRCARNGVAFNWGAMRRHHDGYRQLAAAIAGGRSGSPATR